MQVYLMHLQAIRVLRVNRSLGLRVTVEFTFRL
jgi:hypothetical protein